MMDPKGLRQAAAIYDEWKRLDGIQQALRRMPRDGDVTLAIRMPIGLHARSEEFVRVAAREVADLVEEAMATERNKLAALGVSRSYLYPTAPAAMPSGADDQPEVAA